MTSTAQSAHFGAFAPPPLDRLVIRLTSRLQLLNDERIVARTKLNAILVREGQGMSDLKMGGKATAP
jgi:hypothetical protein